MKRSKIVILLLLLLMTAGYAQQDIGLEVSLSSGFVSPSSPMTFSNYWKMQYGGGASVGFALSPSIILMGSVEYYRFNLSVDGVNEGFDTKYMSDLWSFDKVSLDPSADPSSVMTASLNVRVTPGVVGGMISPYFLVGIGMMRFTLSEIALPTTSLLSLDSSSISMTAHRTITGGEETEVMVQGGLGADIHLMPLLTLFIEARYAQGFSKNLGTAYIPVTLGVRVRL